MIGHLPTYCSIKHDQIPTCKDNHIPSYLVGGFNPSEKYESVGIIIPNWWKVIKAMFQTTKQSLSHEIPIVVHANFAGFLVISPMETFPMENSLLLVLATRCSTWTTRPRSAFHGEHLKKWMVYNGKSPRKFEWFGGSPISGNQHINQMKSMSHDRDRSLLYIHHLSISAFRDLFLSLPHRIHVWYIC